MNSNYAIKPTPEQALGTNRTMPPARLIAALAVMVEPWRDLEDRSKVWDEMQHFWMDTDPNFLLERIAQVCASSKYSEDELEQIFWNEVRPAVGFNLWLYPAPEWSGFEIEWLKERVLKKNRKKLPKKWVHRYSNSWWMKLRMEIERLRECCRSPKTDHLCSLKIDQGWTPREGPSAGVECTGRWPAVLVQNGSSLASCLPRFLVSSRDLIRALAAPLLCRNR